MNSCNVFKSQTQESVKVVYKEDTCYVGFIYNIINLRTCYFVKMKVEFLSKTFYFYCLVLTHCASTAKVQYGPKNIFFFLFLYLANILKFLYRSGRKKKKKKIFSDLRQKNPYNCPCNFTMFKKYNPLYFCWIYKCWIHRKDPSHWFTCSKQAWPMLVWKFPVWTWYFQVQLCNESSASRKGMTRMTSNWLFFYSIYI